MKTEDLQFPKGTLKFVNEDYIVYKKDYLFENLNMEIELLRNTKKFRESHNVKRLNLKEFKKSING